MTEPILKWAGSKRKLLGRVTSLFPRDYRKRAFHEPMFGGGAATFHLAPHKGTVSDIIPRLVRFYEVVRDFHEELIAENKNLEYGNSSADYHRARAEFNNPPRGRKLDKIREASLLLYLNRTCFNGLFRENSRGEFNVPFGNYLNPDFVREKQIRECSRTLRKLEIMNEDFKYVVDKAESGDLVYFNPSYQTVSGTADFTQYAKWSFRFKEQKRLKDTCIKLNEKGVFFVVSNSWDEAVRKLYEKIEGFEVRQVFATRYISAKVETRGVIYKILATNVPKSQRVQRKLTAFEQ